MGAFGNLAAPSQSEFPGLLTSSKRYTLIVNDLNLGQMPLLPDQVFTFLDHRFAKFEVTLQSNTSIPYLDIKQDPFGPVNTRIFMDWETSNDFVRYVKMGTL
jgi:hypothetical protein